MAVSFNDSIKISAPKPLDKRYLNSSNQPYISIAEVNSTIPSTERYVGLTVNINNVEYWYETGILDGDLIEKTLTVNGDGVVTGATYNASILTLKRSEGLSDVTVTIGVTGVTDGVVSGATLSATTLILHRTLDLPNVTVNLSPLLTGATTKDVITTTGATYNISNLTFNTLFLASGTTTYNLPSSPIESTEITISDGIGNAGTTPITLDGGVIPIYDNFSTTALINTDFGSITLLYNGVFWNVIAFVI